MILFGSLAVLFMNVFNVSNRKVGWTAFTFLLFASVIILAVCGTVLVTGHAISANHSILTIDTINASLRFTIDRLSAFFMLVVVILALPVTLFSVAYMEKEKDIRGYYTPLMLFVFGMLGVLCVDDLFFFFIPWEFMSLSAYALILFEKDEPRALRAGLKYFVVTHLGNICLAIGAIILYFNLPAGEASFSFPAISRSMELALSESPYVLNIALCLFFIGFATKSGLFPFGILWLPDAHPAAPSPVSSLLSGAMIKIGVYGFIRVFLFLLPVSATTVAWGWVLAAFGTLSMFLGTLRAMMQHDSKILLAYHSIGQMGYIIMAIGLGMVFLGSSHLIAVMGLVAGFYHLVNHACFKGLLFLNAGSVIHNTGVRNMDSLGGLSKILPVTSVCTLIAVFSIGGLPGFSGFVSKWMIYQTAIAGGTEYFWTVLMAIIAIFISVVTIVSVLKFYSAQFLGHLPKALDRPARSEDSALVIPQVFLAALCVLLGLIPVLGVFPGFSIIKGISALQTMSYQTAFGEFNVFGITLHGGTQAGGVSSIGVWYPPLTVLVFLALMLFGYLVTRSAGATVRTVDNWHCGAIVERDETIYRSTSYYRYLKEFFGLVNVKFVPGNVVFKKDLSKHLNLDNWFYYPFARRFLSTCKWAAKSHVGIPQVYLLWTIVGALVTVLIAFLLI